MIRMIIDQVTVSSGLVAMLNANMAAVRLARR